MHIELIKIDYNTNKESTLMLEVSSYQSLASPTSLLLIREGQMGVDEGQHQGNHPFLELFKVHMIGSCQTQFENAVLIAFYFDENNELMGYPIEGLPRYHHPKGDVCTLLDYESYKQVCEITREKPLPIWEYLDEIKGGSIGINTLMKIGDKILNFNAQTDFWEKEGSPS